MASEIRIDKWLWAVRIFKTRSDAADACRNNRVLINDAYTKPSREIKTGDEISVRRGAVNFRYRVLEPVSSRQSAKNLAPYIEDITPQEELDKLSVPKETIFIKRDRGTGRPTKKDRREIETLMEGFGPDDF